MPRAIATKQYHDFTGGLNTDSTKLNFPENSLVDVRNIIIDKSGKLRRAKYGEEAATATSLSESYSSQRRVNTYVWRSAGSLETFLVVQVADILYFYDLDLTATSYEVNDNYVGEIDLGSSYLNSLLHFSEINDKLLCTSGGSSTAPPFYIEHIAPSTFTKTDFYPDIRDFEGADDGYAVDEQRDYTGDCFLILSGTSGAYTDAESINGSTSGVGVGTGLSTISTDGTTRTIRVTTTTKMTLGETVTGAVSTSTGILEVQIPVFDDYDTSAVNLHLYNLVNQGWGPVELTEYTLDQNKEPSNSMQWILGKDTSDLFDPDLLDKQDFGSAEAPKGRVYYSVLAGIRDEARLFNGIKYLQSVGGIADLAGYQIQASTVAAGRLWMSGGRLPGSHGKKVLFTQILKDDMSNVDRCYQQQDPTAEDFNDLLDNDGGVIEIKEATFIRALKNYQNGVLVFSTNGVWMIDASDTGFTPNNYSVRKITEHGATSAKSIVEVDGAIVYWSDEGIIALAPNPETGYLTATDITSGKINSLYTGKESHTFTPTYDEKLSAWGAYDSVEKKIYWGYSKDTVFSRDDSAMKIMVFNVEQGSFSFLDAAYTYGLHGAFDRDHDGIRFLNVSVTADTISFINLKGDTFLGTTANCYFETFHENLGDTVRDKAATWVLCQFERTEDGYQTVGGGTVFTNPSGCNMRAKWEWTDHADANRWSSSEQVYRLPRLYVPTGASDPFDYGHTVITTKNKVRGHGKAISLRFEAEEDKDFVLLGWAAVYTGSGSV